MKVTEELGEGGGGRQYGGREARWRKKKTAFFRSLPQPNPPVSLRRSHYLKGTGYLLTVQTDEWQWVETGQGDSEER